MSRQLEQALEEKTKRQRLELIRALHGGLEGAVDASGGELLGFSAKLSNGDCLLTLRAEFHEGGMICFVGAADFPDAVRKAVRELLGGQVSWKKDRYASK